MDQTLVSSIDLTHGYQKVSESHVPIILEGCQNKHQKFVVVLLRNFFVHVVSGEQSRPYGSGGSMAVQGVWTPALLIRTTFLKKYTFKTCC